MANFIFTGIYQNVLPQSQKGENMRKIDNCVYALIGRKGIQTAQRLPQPQNFAVVTPSVLNRYEAKAKFLKNAAN